MEVALLNNEDVPLAYVSLISMENQFHPLSNTNGEEHVKCITTIFSPLVIRQYHP